jgi:hypothetical protein
MEAECVLVLRKLVISHLRTVLRRELQNCDLRNLVSRKLESGEWQMVSSPAGLQVWSASDRSVVLALDEPAATPDEQVDAIIFKILSIWDSSDLFFPRPNLN